MTIEELLERMRAIIERSDAEERSLNDEEVTEYESLERELEAKRRDVEVRARQTAYETPNRSDLHVNAGNGHEEDPRAAEHRAAFNRYLRTGDKGLVAEFRAQSVGTNSEGGFTAPDEFRQKLVDRMVAFGGLASRAETITTENGNALSWVTLDDTANSGEIVAEGAAGSGGADLVFGQKSLGAYRYTAPGADNTGADPLRVSVELLQDSAFDIEALLVRKLGERIARKQAVDWVAGTGTGEPEGITSAAATDTFDTFNTPDHADLVSILHALDPAYQSNAEWLMNFATLGYFRGLEDGNGRPLWLPQSDSGLTTLPGGTLLGRPVVIDQAMPDVGTASAKAIVYGDLAESYVIRRVRDVQLVVDPYTRAANGQVCFTVWARADGAIQNDDSFVILANTAL